MLHRRSCRIRMALFQWYPDGTPVWWYPPHRGGHVPTITFIARGIAGLEIPETGRVEYFDRSTPGFGLRVTCSGHRSWICFYRYKGEKRRYTIGTYPQLGLADAREQAKEVLRRAIKGEDPATEKKRERTAETFRE